MSSRFRKIMLSDPCRFGRVLLLVTWIMGLVFGNLSTARADATYFLLMCMAPSCRVSIAGLLASVALPFLFSVFAVYIGRPGLLYPVCFCKAFLFSLGFAGSRLAFGSAGWLVGSLLLFSDICFLPVLCWFWLRQLSGSMTGFRRDTALCALAAVFIGSVDICVVSPFLAMLIDN